MLPATLSKARCCRILPRMLTIMPSAHTMLRPHGCRHCEQRFKKNSGLERHVNTMHETLTIWSCANLLNTALALDMGGRAAPCRLCRESIEALDDAHTVVGQMLSHTESRHAVGRCDQVGFARSDHFRDHLRGFHGITNEDVLRELVGQCKTCTRGDDAASG